MPIIISLPQIPLVVSALLVLFLIVRQVISSWQIVHSTFQEAGNLTQELRQINRKSSQELQEINLSLHNLNVKPIIVNLEYD
ncbi:hypothetical protein [Adhaeribacter radiodurans]|uniref:Uncharacterized protein n=1 Tax=Adhaeribacter radiodurans TaxID=2745197 RepID=A0A7L7LB38_9BACT|nr:hypothetical protein [Adhaeribacter radiodurans]QMU29934.1 hypothetical protein HUW48_18725 [Adhaeribacter radiodurans]